MNRGLSAATEKTMLARLGSPGALTKDCSQPSEALRRRIQSSVNVGPFSVNGLDFAVESLRQLIGEVKHQLPDVFAQVKTAGVLCVRARRKNPSKYSNHSWGCSIDLYFGTAVVPQGEQVTHRGNLLLAPYFERYGWYWGAEFSGDYVDSMHFELAEQTVLKMPSLVAPMSDDDA